jgi:hypothetical protein
MKHQSVSIYIAQETLALIAMVLVFLPSSNHWFRHRAVKAEAR